MIFKRLLDNIKKSSFWKNVAVLSTGSIIAQAIGVLTTPIVSRIYTPSDFGEYAIIISTTAIIVNIISLGLYSAIMVTKSEKETNEVFSTALLISISFLAIVISIYYTILVVFELNPSQFSNPIYLLFVLLYSICVNINSILVVYTNKKGLYRVLFVNSIIGAVSTLVITIPLGLLMDGPIGLIVASILSSILCVVQMWIRVKPTFSILSFNKLKNVLFNNRKFIVYQYPANFADTVSKQFPNQMLVQIYGNEQLGSYNMNEKVLGIPSRLIGAPLNTVYFKTASDNSNNFDLLSKITFSLVSKIMIIAIFPVILFTFFGPELFVFALGEKWEEAGILSPFLIVIYVFTFCSTVTSYCKVSIGKQAFNLISGIIKLLIIIFVFLFASKNNFSLQNTVLLYAIAVIFYEVVDMFMNFVLMKKFWLKYILFVFGYLAIILSIWIIAEII